MSTTRLAATKDSTGASDGALSAPSTSSDHRVPPSLRILWSRWRWMLVPLTIFGLTRMISGYLLSVGAQRQVALTEDSPAYHLTTPTDASPGYLGVISNWDGQWFRSIAESGYPVPLPMEDGQVVQNEWAFSPGYPTLVRLVMMLTRTDFPLAATVVSLVCSGLAVLLVYRLLMTRADSFVATTAVLGLCSFPASPILQVAYSESLALLLVVTALVLLTQRRYGWLVVVAFALCLTRPLTLPLAAVIGVHWLVRWRRSDDLFPVRDRLWAGGAALASAMFMGVWPLIAAVVTGTTDAFTATIAAWPGNSGDQGLLTNWLVLAATGVGPVTVFVLMVLMFLLYAVFRRGSRNLGADVRAWSLIYPVYMLAVTRPNAGVLRYLVLAVGVLWPLPDLVPERESRVQFVVRWAMPILFAIASMVGQYYWVTRIFIINGDPGMQPFP